ncbi:BhlA/UviB family holin-like peptide [Romboutsia ilealis]|uniref:BhlA/UviB family holin-like peptide n=1 Tax=Romboutsia ilealis TaxID=1115758 RepID=UPI00259D1F81|nr:BhlA/UviB family holin-like peptide [Romboutsia ilealis]
MSTEIINFFISQGVFAVLFGYLFLYVLKENSIREAKYQELLYELTDLLPEIKKDILSIKESLKSK